jgi:lipid-A-disaccharide synthase
MVANGPGELYTWAQPMVRAFRQLDPSVHLTLVLIPCQFASGSEADIAATFDVDRVVTPGEFMRSVPAGRTPEGVGGRRGVVLQLGGSITLAAQLAKTLRYPFERYAFTAVTHPRLDRLHVSDKVTAKKAQRGLALRRKTVVQTVGNLVADAVEASTPAAWDGSPRVLLVPGSRDGFAVVLIPFMLAVADAIRASLPNASFAWPLSRLLDDATVERGVAGLDKDALGGTTARLEGDRVVTEAGTVVQLIGDNDRHAFIQAADAALTIPGTNTLELGVANLPAVVMLPMNEPERIPLEGVGHFLGLIPLVGKPLKRLAVRLFVEKLDQPISLPNRVSGERIYREVAGILSVDQIAREMTALLTDEAALETQRAALKRSMPKPGASERLARDVLTRLAAEA